MCPVFFGEDGGGVPGVICGRAAACPLEASKGFDHELGSRSDASLGATVPRCLPEQWDFALQQDGRPCRDRIDAHGRDAG